MKKVGCISGAVGFLFGIIVLGGAMLIFGDYDDPPPVAQTQAAQPVAATQSVTTVTPQPTATATSEPAGLSLGDICDVSRRNLTQPQMQAHARSFEGQSFTGWHLYVYDVQIRRDGYRLLLSSQNQEPAIVWTRDVEIDDIPEDLAARLNVNQPVVLSGTIAEVETGFGVMCNPLRVADWSLAE